MSANIAELQLELNNKFMLLICRHFSICLQSLCVYVLASLSTMSICTLYRYLVQQWLVTVEVVFVGTVEPC